MVVVEGLCLTCGERRILTKHGECENCTASKVTDVQLFIKELTQDNAVIITAKLIAYFRSIQEMIENNAIQMDAPPIELIKQGYIACKLMGWTKEVAGRSPANEPKNGASDTAKEV